MLVRLVNYKIFKLEDFSTCSEGIINIKKLELVQKISIETKSSNNAFNNIKLKQILCAKAF